MHSVGRRGRGVGAAWAPASGCSPGSKIARVDARTGRETEIDVGVSADDIVPALGSVWVVSDRSANAIVPGVVVRLDPATGRVIGRFSAPSLEGVAVGFGALWLRQGGELLEARPG